MRLAAYSGYVHPDVMIRELGLTGAQMMDVLIYAGIEPVGEPMADYSAGEPKRQQPMDPAKRRAILRSMFPSKPKAEE